MFQGNRHGAVAFPVVPGGRQRGTLADARYPFPRCGAEADGGEQAHERVDAPEGGLKRPAQPHFAPDHLDPLQEQRNPVLADTERLG
jgi:hypothetical protein